MRRARSRVPSRARRDFKFSRSARRAAFSNGLSIRGWRRYQSNASGRPFPAGCRPSRNWRCRRSRTTTAGTRRPFRASKRGVTRSRAHLARAPTGTFPPPRVSPRLRPPRAHPPPQPLERYEEGLPRRRASPQGKRVAVRHGRAHHGGRECHPGQTTEDARPVLRGEGRGRGAADDARADDEVAGRVPPVGRRHEPRRWTRPARTRQEETPRRQRRGTPRGCVASRRIRSVEASEATDDSRTDTRQNSRRVFPHLTRRRRDGHLQPVQEDPEEEDERRGDGRHRSPRRAEPRARHQRMR